MEADGSIPLWPLWLIFIALIIAGAYFAGAESAFAAVNRIRIKSKADEGNRRARSVLRILDRFEQALTTLLVGNNITHIAAASVAAVIATRLFAGRGVDVNGFAFAFLCTVAGTAVIFLFSEMIPKSFANDRSESMSLASGRSLLFLMRILTPLTAFFGLISKGASRLFARKKAPTITEDELMDIIDTVEEEGVVDEEQGDMLKSALEFGDTTVGDIMTMARDMETLDVAAPNEEIAAAVCRTVHSRLPVYAGSPDHIIGTLRIRRFLTAYRQNPRVKLRTLIAAPYFIREDAKIDDVLDDMRQHKHHMAVVVDDADKAVGLVTIEDMLEELVGEIFDEEDVVDRNFQSLGGDKYMVNTHMLVGNLYHRMGHGNAPRAVAAKPLLSLMLEQLGRLPDEEESFIYDGIEYTVDTVENACPTQVLVHILSEEDKAERAASGEADHA